jgi:F-type H+-transporting ATPase subunit gamma
MVYPRPRGGAAWEVTAQSLLPLDLGTFTVDEARSPPLHNLPALRLIERLIGEYVFAQLAHAAMETLAAENAARFGAMSATRENVSKLLGDLRGEERHLRQEEITAEMLEVVSGAETQLNPNV